ncbi:MAG: hypothetical protein AAF605_08110 [Myxococcota bacterium]
MTKMIQVRNVPDALHEALVNRAARARMSLSDYLLVELRALADTPTLDELFERISHREAIEPSESSVSAVRAERDAR